MSTELQESFLQAISKIADDSISKSKSDLTIECKIVKVQNSAKGIYTVQYTENNFTAHSANGANYAVNDSVYVLVPEGDFSKNKVIIGLTKAMLPEDISKRGEKFYNEVSPNFLEDMGEIQLCTYHTETKSYSPSKQLIAALIEPYNNFVFQVDVRTDIKDIIQRNTGKYGITIKIPVLNSDLNEVGETITTQDYIEKTIDIEHMIGDVYGFNVYTKQQVYFDFEGRRYDNSRPLQVTAFVDGFIQNENVLNPDIFFKNIELKAVEKLTDEQLAGYYLNVKCEKGFEFLSGAYTEDKILQPELMINGASVNIKEYECYWFKENNSITDSSEDYTPLGGIGWQVLNNKKRVDIDNEGNPIYKYETLKNYTLKVKQEDVFYKARYKCILINSNGTYEKAVTITNLNDNIDISLETSTGLKTYIKDVGNVTLKAKLRFPGAPANALFQYRFTRTDKENVVILDEQPFYTVNKKDVLENGIHVTEITFPVSLIDEIATINCEFIYQKLIEDSNTQEGTIEEESLGSAHVTLTTGENLSEYIVRIENKSVNYKYDANGVAPNQGTFDGPIECRILEIAPLIFRLIKTEDNLELSTSEYSQLKITWQIPKKSLYVIKQSHEAQMGTFQKTEDENYIYYSGKGLQKLYYDINPSFDSQKKDAVIYVSYTFDGKEPTPTPVYIHFIKDGESGTNGRAYSASITYEGYEYGVLDNRRIPHKFRGISANGVWKKYDSGAKRLRDFTEGGAPLFEVQVFRGSEIITTDYSVKWSIVDPSNKEDTSFSIADAGNNRGRLSIVRNWTNSNVRPVNVIQADITIKATTSNKNTADSEVITAYYPLDVAFFNNNSPFIPSIENGYSIVTYNNDLTIPKYNMDNPFEITTIDDSIEFTVRRWESSEATLKNEDKNYEKTQKFSPVSRYDIDNVPYQNNYVAVQIVPNGNLTTTKQRELKSEINTLEFQQEELRIKKDFYNRIQSLFDYEDYIEKIKGCEQLLSYKSKYLLYLKDLYDLAKDIKDIDNSYSAYEAMVSEVLYNVLDASSIDDIDKYEGGEIIEPTSNSSAILYDLIEQFNDKINECNTMYNMVVKYTHAPSEISSLSAIVNSLKSLSEDIYSININSEYSDLINERKMLCKALKAYSNDVSITTSKNTLINTLNQVQELLSDYQITKYDKEVENDLKSQIEETYRKIGLETQTNSYSSSSIIVIVRPIVLTVNRFGFAAINGWTNGKLYTGNNDEFLFAPQLGAGVKNNATGTFTGLIMGKKKPASGYDNNKTQIGLFGYKDTIETISLNAETGKLSLGAASKGQIILDPNGTSRIAGWTFTSNGLAKDSGTNHLLLNSNGSNDAIKAYNDSGREVRITYDGRFYANTATITGTITATEGTIGGWKIDGQSLHSKNKKIYLNASSDKIEVGNITLNGSDNTITIGGYYSASMVIGSGNSGIHLETGSSNYNGRIWSGSTNGGFDLRYNYFRVGNSFSYILYNGSSLEVKGSLSVTDGGYVGNWRINSGGLSSSYSSITPTQLKYGSNFIVDSNGQLTCSGANISGKITATDGSIGGWKIESSELKYSDRLFLGKYPNADSSWSGAQTVLANGGGYYAGLLSNGYKGGLVIGYSGVDAIYLHSCPSSITVRGTESDTSVARNIVYLTAAFDEMSTDKRGNGKLACKQIYIRNDNTKNKWVSIWNYIKIAMGKINPSDL